MLLLSKFKEIVSKISPELCWFTTFNLNVELLEKYILSALVGKDQSELKRAEDYEALNLDLEKYDVKVWYDHRALDLSYGKRTTVDLFPVNAPQLLDSYTSEPIFHPKVVFLKGKQKAYLITGSFNLTVAGWSSNRECICIKEITTKENATQIVDFFESISGNRYNALRKWAETLSRVKPKWKFAHNFNTDNLIEAIQGKHLHIWSPYFSKSTSVLLSEIKKAGFEKIHLIPDISVSQKVRITPSELAKIDSDRSISLLKDKSIDKEKQSLFHAKVWLTENTIAIGSWNCSNRATGINTHTKEKNIEAGIIETIESTYRTKLLNQLIPIEHELLGTEEQELEKEWEEVLNKYTFSCSIIANWEDFTYKLELNEFPKDLTIALPHDPNTRISLNQVDNTSFQANYIRVLKNKLFTVYNSKNEVVFVGYLNDTNKPKRPVEGYVSFYDLFESLNIDPLKTTVKARTKYQFEDEIDNGTEKETLPYFNYSGHESYYLMFVAFQKLLDTIKDNKENAQKLDAIGFRLPSSLNNIKTLYATSLEIVLEKYTKNDEDELLFHYLMATEINDCIKEFNKYSENAISDINSETITKIENKLGLKKTDTNFIKKAKTIL